MNYAAIDPADEFPHALTNDDECMRVLQAGERRPHNILGFAEQLVPIPLVARRYRRLALRLHPDKNNSKIAEKAFKLLCQAFETLSSLDGQESVLEDRRAESSPSKRRKSKRKEWRNEEDRAREQERDEWWRHRSWEDIEAELAAKENAMKATFAQWQQEYSERKQARAKRRKEKEIHVRSELNGLFQKYGLQVDAEKGTIHDAPAPAPARTVEDSWTSWSKTTNTVEKHAHINAAHVTSSSGSSATPEAAREHTPLRMAPRDSATHAAFADVGDEDFSAPTRKTTDEEKTSAVAQHVDAALPVCELCRRKFKSSAHLRRHEKLSKLHASHLRLQQEARETAAAAAPLL